MERGKITVTKRNTTGKGPARRLRAEGLVPGICYGPKMGEPVQISVDPKLLRASLDPKKRTNSILEVTIDDEGKTETIQAMVREFQIDHIKRVVTHVDLVAIDPEEPLVTTVPISHKGKAIGVGEGGRLQTVIKQIKISARPGDIPEGYVLDVSPLRIGQSLAVKDIDPGEGVKIITRSTQTIVSCVASRAAATAATGAEETAAPAAAAKKEG